MNARISSGFTIIETMLFLAVTSLLIIGALVGVGTALNNQRYRDAVETFKTTVQDQYAELGSIKNDRGDNKNCGADAIPVDGTEYRGQSDCLIVGRYMLIEQGKINIFTVLANGNAIPSSVTTDISALKSNYTYNITKEVESRTMEWGTEAGWPTDGQGAKTPQTPSSLAILFIRSPETGDVYTFTTNDVPASLDAINSATFTDMMNETYKTAATGRGERTICVVQEGAFAVGGDRSIYINALATTASSVEIRSNDLEGANKC